MPLLEDLIEITQKTPSGAHNEVALLVNNAPHSLQEIDAVLYELLLLGHFPTAFVMSELLINSGHRSHAIGISHLIEALLSNKRDQVVVGIQITQLTYSRFFPRRRRQLIHEVIAPIVRRLETVDLLHDEKKLKKLRWLLGFVCPELTIARDNAPRFSDLTQQHSLKTKVVDIGASDIGWPPPYESMLDEGATLLGFEPSESAFQNLLQDPKPNREYLQVAVGDGEKKLLNFFNDPGMTSCLPPNKIVLDIFFPYNTEVTKSEEIQTKRLDEIDEIDGIDLLKMDIQGFELEVLRNATTKLTSTLVIDIEVSFVELYEG